ncbi:MAG TPA: hypothetical protein VF024_12195 [Solirubrobacteraceae bacterium]
MTITAIANDLDAEIRAGHSITDVLAVAAEHSTYVSIDRNTAIHAIRAALRRRSGKTWSVTGGRGTGWGWIRICAPRARLTGERVETGERTPAGDPTYTWIDTGEYTGSMTEADMRELGELLGLGRDASQQGVSVPSSSGHYYEYIARAEGRSPTTYGKQYWD